VMSKAGCSRDEAKSALKESGGVIAGAIKLAG
jgi:NACalpha-BTF3-like transcription factor